MSHQQDNQNQQDKSPQVFICYAREDLDMAKQVYDDLERAGVSPWIDREELLAGQKWELIIKQAMKSSSYVLVLLSQTSISKRGFVQHEIKHAIKLSEEFPSSAIFILPVRLEECEPPEELEGLQWVDLFPDYQAGLTQLLKVLAPEGRENLLRRKFALIQQELIRLEQERGVETDSEQIRRLDAEITEAQEQQKQTLKKVGDEYLASMKRHSLPLRREPRPLSQGEVRELQEQYQDIRNDFEDLGEIIIDRTTGLTWQKSGSKKPLLYKQTQEYVKRLNWDKFAGYGDWRLPTLPELLSLLNPRQLGSYINPIFNKNQRWCWSADTVAGLSASVWDVDFSSGGVGWRSVQYPVYVRCVRSIEQEEESVKVEEKPDDETRLDAAIMKHLLSDERSTILSAYARIPDEHQEQYRNALNKKLSSPSSHDRLMALTAIFVIYRKKSVSSLMRMADDPSGAVRRRAVLYLGEIRASKAVPLITERFSDKDRNVREAARTGYKKITGRDAYPGHFS